MNAHHIDQQALLTNEKDPLTHTPVHLLSLENVGKHYGNIVALTDVTMAVDNGRVTVYQDLAVVPLMPIWRRCGTRRTAHELAEPPTNSQNWGAMAR